MSFDRSIDSAADSRSSRAQSVAMSRSTYQATCRGDRRVGRRAGSAPRGSTAVPCGGQSAYRAAQRSAALVAAPCPTPATTVFVGAAGTSSETIAIGHRARSMSCTVVRPRRCARRPELRPTARSWASRSSTTRSSSSAQLPVRHHRANDRSARRRRRHPGVEIMLGCRSDRRGIIAGVHVHGVNDVAGCRRVAHPFERRSRVGRSVEAHHGGTNERLRSHDPTICLEDGSPIGRVAGRIVVHTVCQPCHDPTTSLRQPTSFASW